MKKFFFFVLGVLISTTLLAVGVFFFLRTPSIDPKNLQTGVLGTEFVNVEVNLLNGGVATEAEIKSVETIFAQVRPVDNDPPQGGNEMAKVPAQGRPMAAPFPRKVLFKVLASDLNRFREKDPNNLVHFTINLCHREDPSVVDPEACDRHLSFQSRVAIKAAGKFTAGDTLSLGNLYVSRRMPVGWNSRKTPCLTGNGQLTGKIFATKGFLSKMPAGKKALYAVRFSQFSALKAPASRISTAIVDAHFFEPSVTGTPFSVPASKFTMPDYYQVYVGFCNAGESEADCAVRTFPHIYPTNEGRDFVQAQPEKLRFPHCSDSTPTNFHVFWPEPLTPNSTPRSARNVDPDAQPEALVGQFI